MDSSYTSLIIMKDPIKAEEIMKESLLSASDTISTYSGNLSLVAWLKNIVINRSPDVIRKVRNDILEKFVYLQSVNAFIISILLIVGN
jgi:DNA-directed RNA polymerase specialized sigma24 family protein